MDPHRQCWATRQQEVRRLLVSGRPENALSLWRDQHAALHARELASADTWSFQDEVLAGLSEEQLRRIADPGTHSIAWLLWHIARIEDVTMNLLVAGTAQVLDGASWLGRLGLARRDVGTAMGDSEVATISASLNLDSLLAYRLAVGRRTQEIAGALGPGDLRARVDPGRIQALLASGALADGAIGLAEAWRTWTTVRFLMMPATRHAFTHLNEARRVGDWLRQSSYAR